MNKFQLDRRNRAFKKDLQALLQAYGAQLEVLIEGDTHGVYDEGIAVSFPPTPGGRWDASTEPVRLSSSFSLDTSDLD